MTDNQQYAQKRPIVYLIGIGMGGEDQLTGQAIDRLEAAEAVMGAGRMLDSVEAYIQGKPVLSAYKPLNGWRRLWFCREIRDFTAGQKRPPAPLAGRDGK